MLKYSVWYVIHESHPIHKMVNKYSSLFKTHTPIPHISIQSNLNKSDAITIYNRYLSVDKPVFTSSGYPIIRQKEDTYTIEQPLCTNGRYVEDIHISLAYRMRSTFTPMELAHTVFVPRIYDSDLSLSIVEWKTDNPQNLKRVK